MFIHRACSPHLLTRRLQPPPSQTSCQARQPPPQRGCVTRRCAAIHFPLLRAPSACIFFVMFNHPLLPGRWRRFVCGLLWACEAHLCSYYCACTIPWMRRWGRGFKSCSELCPFGSAPFHALRGSQPLPVPPSQKGSNPITSPRRLTHRRPCGRRSPIAAGTWQPRLLLRCRARAGASAAAISR